MNRIIRSLCAMLLLSLASLNCNTALAQVRNIESQGNLQSLNDIGCASQDRLKNTYTPADLYRGTAECVKEKNYDAADFLWALAGVYANYDSMRVTDKTAHQAGIVLRRQYASSFAPEQRETFVKSLSALLADPKRLAIVCGGVRKIGPPNYYPTYMIQHGMGAFSPSTRGSGLVANFDGTAAWKTLLGSYLHCPSGST